ncbi:MAG: hypothetical protein EBR22_00805, partial [Cytophagia bacterium]|nr:hypothetical protein [Cytophagia bacterium]
GQNVDSRVIRISIDSLSVYHLEQKPLSKLELQAEIRTLAATDTGQTLLLQAHQRVPVQEVVDVMQWSREAGLKMVLATDPR